MKQELPAAVVKAMDFDPDAAAHVVADTIVRTAASFEIPIGILTSVVGIPFFIVLLKRAGKGWL